MLRVHSWLVLIAAPGEAHRTLTGVKLNQASIAALDEASCGGQLGKSGICTLMGISLKNDQILDNCYKVFSSGLR